MITRMCVLAGMVSLFVGLIASFSIAAEDAPAKPKAMDEPALTPVYDGLERTEFEVVFKLVDAKDKPVIADKHMGPVRAVIRRKYGKCSWPVHARHSADMILAKLPSGSYELIARLGFYGAIRHDFEVVEEPIEDTLQLPYWRRVIEFVLQDQDGNKLEYTYGSPDYWPLDGLASAHASFAEPSSRLRLPLHKRTEPGPPEDTSVGLGWPRILTKTKAGSIWVVVFAGQKSKMQFRPCFPYQKIEASHEFDTTFCKIENDRVTVTFDLEGAERIDPDTETLKVVNANDSGYETLKEVSPPHKYWRKSPEESISRRHPPVELDLTPTQLSAFVSVGYDRHREFPAVREGNKVWLNVDRSSSAYVRLQFYSTRNYVRERMSNELELYDRFCLLEKRNFRGHRVCHKVDPNPDHEPNKIPGVYMRVVDQSGQGLPFVEAVFMPLDENELTATVFEAEKARAKKEDRPKLTDDQIETLLDVDETYTDDELREVLDDIHDGLYDALENRAARMYFCTNGTWYDPWTQMRGDTDGYFIAPDQKMELGKKYVLYVWTNSTDDLDPDYRFVFEGQGETTDLGCLVLNDR